jgi:hypothetical protein
VALLVSVSVCVAAVAILINSFSFGSSTNVEIDPPPIPPITTEGGESNAIFTNFVAVVMSATGGTGGFKVIDVDTDISLNLTVDAGTRMSDRFDRPLVLEEFTPGSIVDISFDESNNTIRAMQMNSVAWERRLVRNVRIDSAASTIAIGNDVYTYTEDIVALSKGQRFDMSRISGIDLLNIKGYRNKAWFIELVSGSGIIEITNKAAIKNGTIEIGTNILHALEDVESVELLAGHHRVVVRGDNIELYIEEIEVIEGERQVIDLSNVRMLSGVLEITSNVSGFKAFVDGREVSLLAPIPLEYGEYSLRITMDGYEPFESQVTVGTEVVTVNAELKRIVNIGNLVIETFPNGAAVFINDVKRGDAPCTIPLEYGTYSMRVASPDYQDYVMTIEIFDREHKYNIQLIQLDDLWID